MVMFVKKYKLEMMKEIQNSIYRVVVIIFYLSLLTPSIMFAQNVNTQATNNLIQPIINEPGMSDPHALVVGDTVYLFTGHDIGVGVSDWIMPDWRIYRSVDLKNWKLVGTIKPEENYMGKGSTTCWAGDIAKRNGKYYWYFSDRKKSIGVMVASKPEGPFVDALKKPLIVDAFDPTIFTDDDATQYIVYGEHQYKIARLKRSMTELDETPRDIVINRTTYFPSADKNYLHKHNGIYYLSCSGYYATSKNVYGPYEAKGLVAKGLDLETTWGHGDFFVWKGNWYHVWCKYRDRNYDRIRDCFIAPVTYDKDGMMYDNLNAK